MLNLVHEVLTETFAIVLALNPDDYQQSAKCVICSRSNVAGNLFCT